MVLKHTFYNPDEKLNQIQLCTIIHNRDKNTVQNILNIVEYIKKQVKDRKFLHVKK